MKDRGDDAFLVLGKNGNGSIDGVLKETVACAPLADLDNNKDGKFNRADVLLANVNVMRTVGSYAKIKGQIGRPVMAAMPSIRQG